MNYLNIFWQFLVLGLFSFGGPIAHISIFRKKFVENLKWLDDREFSEILALSNFLPGPSSSQVGFSIGLKKGGLVGGIMAFLAFTLPSFLLLYFTFILEKSFDDLFVIGLITGLKLFAVIIVLDAVVGMFSNLCKTDISRIIFLTVTFILIFFQSFYMQIIVILLAGIYALVYGKDEDKTEKQVTKKKLNFSALFLFVFFLLVFPFIFKGEISNLFNSFYQIGSLVFGGGHVVLPLISSNINLSQDTFITAYSLAQAVPGPMFTIASYLGASFLEDSPIIGALVATLAIFLPGFLLIITFKDSFQYYSKNRNFATLDESLIEDTSRNRARCRQCRTRCRWCLHRHASRIHRRCCSPLKRRASLRRAGARNS